MQQADKRAHHNALERKRRDHIKDSFTLLRDTIPTLSGEKVSRAQILNKATDYIQFMRKRNATHQAEVEELRRQNDALATPPTKMAKGRAKSSVMSTAAAQSSMSGPHPSMPSTMPSAPRTSHYPLSSGYMAPSSMPMHGAGVSAVSASSSASMASNGHHPMPGGVSKTMSGPTSAMPYTTAPQSTMKQGGQLAGPHAATPSSSAIVAAANSRAHTGASSSTPSSTPMGAPQSGMSSGPPKP
eukprot:m.13249 g.13249  ORF g.13249 m.13249 type:complete len:242 (+) comp5924_c0_seq1:126-851(+)